MVATIPVGDGQVTIAGAVVTINPTADLADETDYYIQVTAGAITDLDRETPLLDCRDQRGGGLQRPM